MDPTTPQAPAATSPEDGKNSAPAVAPVASASEKGEKTYTDAEVQSMIQERLDRQKRAIEADQTKKQRTATETELAEQQQFKPLAEQRAARITELETANAALTRQLLIAQHGRDLPAALQQVVQGTTEDEIKAHIAELRKLVAPPAAPDTEAGKGNRPTGAAPPPTPPPASKPPSGTYTFQQPGDVPW